MSRATVVLGAQWGDEGKGKVVDLLGKKMSVVARCAGGNNAGHTVVVGDTTYDFHLLPIGILHEHCMAVIGNGVVVNVPSLFAEIEKNKLEGWEKRLLVSERAQLVLDVHMLVDGLSEAAGKAKATQIGTTKKGIGPAYSTKAWRNGIRLGTLLGDWERFKLKYNTLVDYFKRSFPDLNVDTDKELKTLEELCEKLLSLKIVTDTAEYVHKALSEGKTVLVEGANGALLDVDFGSYPYVTSSACCVGGVCTGLGIPPSSVGEVIGVAKAYQTRVGDGPFPTELAPEEAEALRTAGGEFGVTTGRPRRTGHLDLFLLAYSCRRNGFTSLALTKLDILDTFSELKVAIGYRRKGSDLIGPPGEVEDWEDLEVEYKTMPGWKKPTADIRRFEDLPKEAQDYVLLVEEHTKTKVKYIGVGKEREAIIIR